MLLRVALVAAYPRTVVSVCSGARMLCAQLLSAVLLPVPGVIRERHTPLESEPSRSTRELDIATPH